MRLHTSPGLWKKKPLRMRISAPLSCSSGSFVSPGSPGHGRDRSISTILLHSWLLMVLLLLAPQVATASAGSSFPPILLGSHLCTKALAGGDEARPDISYSEDGAVVAALTLPYPESQVRQILADPIGSANLNPDVISVQVESRSRCDNLFTRTRGLLHSLTFRSRRCPTAKGWSESLVQSEDFLSMESEWAISETPQGTRIVLKVVTVLTFPVPEVLLKRGVLHSVKSMMNNLVARLEQLSEQGQ